MIVLLVLVHLAQAAPGEPSLPVVGADAGIRTDVVVAATPDQIRAAMADPVAAIELCADVISARVVGRSGDCSILLVTTRGLVAPLGFMTRRCPTAEGWAETLVSSDDFDRQDTTLRLEPVSGGTRIVLEVHSEPRLPLPRRLLQSEIAKSTVATLENIVRKVTGR